MPLTNQASAEQAAPTYLGRGDPARVVTDFASHATAASDYFPVWLKCLADDVTLEGSMMDGAVQGPDAVLEVVGAIRTLYEHQEFIFAGPYGDDGFLEVYNARVRGEPIGAFVQVTRNAVGQAQHIAANYRPRTTLLLLSRLVGEHFAGTPIGEHFATRAD
jgi:hypothetical protein